LLLARITEGDKQILDEGTGAFLKKGLQRGVEGVVVLLDEVDCLVAHCSSKVSDYETVLVPYLAVLLQLGVAGQGQSKVCGVEVVNLLCEVFVVGGGELGLLVEDVHDAGQLELHQVNAVLVVYKGDGLQAQTLLHVQRLFVFKNSRVEKLLQFFVAVVDAKLFEAVHRKILESCNVQNSDVELASLK